MPNLPSWMSTAISALPSLISAFIGGAIVAVSNQFFAVQLEQEKTLLELRRSAYANFFRGQTLFQRVEQGGLPKEESDRLWAEYNSLVREARFDIAVYSSKPIVDAMSNYFREYFPDERKNCSSSRRKMMDDINIYQQMRRELFGDNIIQKILRGSEKVDDDRMVLMIHHCLLPPN